MGETEGNGMTIDEALGMLSGPVRSEYSEAITNRWKALRREQEAEKAVTVTLRPGTDRLRDYVVQRLGLVHRETVNIFWNGRTFYIDHSEKPELIGPYLNFDLTGQSGISVHVHCTVMDREHLDRILDAVKPHVEAMKAESYKTPVAWGRTKTDGTEGQ